MGLLQTGLTASAIIGAFSAYMMQIYGAYTAKKEDDGVGEIDVGYIVGGAVLNSIVTLYLLYYLFEKRYDKHGEYFKVVGSTLLIAGLCVDIFLAAYVVQLPTIGDRSQAYIWIYFFSTFNFLVRVIYTIQFQCTDILAHRVKPSLPVQQQDNKFIRPNNNQNNNRPERGPNPFVKPEEGGRR